MGSEPLRTGSLGPHRASLAAGHHPIPALPCSPSPSPSEHGRKRWHVPRKQLGDKSCWHVPPLKSRCPQELGHNPWEGSEGATRGAG